MFNKKTKKKTFVKQNTLKKAKCFMAEDLSNNIFKYIINLPRNCIYIPSPNLKLGSLEERRWGGRLAAMRMV